MSASTTSGSATPCSPYTVSWRWVSSWSSSTSCAGPNSATWRAISEPIQPPPPVTSTRRPCSSWRTGSRSMSTCSRPSRSSMLRSLISRRRGMPWTHDDDSRSTRTGIVGRLGGVGDAAGRPGAAPTAWPAGSGGRRGRSTISGSSSIPPAMRTPWIERLRSAGLSSTATTGHEAEDRRLLHLAQRGRAVGAGADDRDAHAGAAVRRSGGTRTAAAGSAPCRTGTWRGPGPATSTVSGTRSLAPHEAEEQDRRRWWRRPTSRRTASSMLAWRQVRP